MTSLYSQSDIQIGRKLTQTVNSIRNHKGSTASNRYQSLIERLRDLKDEAESRPALIRIANLSTTNDLLRNV